MHRYRSHTCGALRASDIGNDVRLSGWCHRVRDHGGVLFIDLRDHYGITQVVADPDSPAFKVAETLRSEWVVRIDGKVRRRPEGTVNADLPTGDVEIYIREIEVLGRAAELPMPVFGDQCLLRLQLCKLGTQCLDDLALAGGALAMLLRQFLLSCHPLLQHPDRQLFAFDAVRRCDSSPGQARAND